MKRFTMIVALVLMVVMPTFAERVTTETARKVATTFLNNNGAKTAQLTDLSKEAGFPNLYIFNTEQGFVIMAADNCVQPILGYSLTGKFVAENIPSNVHNWLQGYNDEIQSAIENRMKATAETVQLWKDLMEGNSKAARASVVVAPLIQTKWNQNKYYNNLCPAMQGGPDGHAYTGCTATAMAQVMKYYNYPSKGIGSHSYDWNGQILSADFGSTYYDWDNMAEYYEYYYDDNGTPHWLPTPSSVEITAVATLMYHCGISVDMNYRPSGSGASILDAANALKNFFNYSSTTEYKIKSNYDDAVWKTMVKEELNEGRPLEYAGYDPNGTSGHAFVCDGYNSDDYFHFNWGWAGHYDGYFSLSNLDTGANSSDPGAGNGVYTRDQEAIFGIQPVQCSASDPTNLTYTLTGIQDVILNWTTANGAASYNIYRNNSYVGNSSTNSYTETAPYGTNVYYVRSVDANGQLSLSSNSVTITVEYATPIVDDLEASISGNNISLSWSAPDWCYPETPSANLTYGTQNPNAYFLWNGSRYWGHRHLAENISMYNGLRLYNVDFFVYNSGTYEVIIFEGTSTNYNTIPMTQVYSQSVSATGPGWNTINLTEPYYINGNQDLWIFIHNPVSIENLLVYICNAEGNEGIYHTEDPSWYTWNTNSGYAFLIKAYLTDGIYTYNLYRNDALIAQNLSNTTYNTQLSSNNANLFSVKTNYYGGETVASNKIGFAKGNASLSTLSLGSNDRMTVMANSKLTVSGTLSSGNAESLVLENGAQLVNNSDNVHATVKKNITAYTESQSDGWHILASPMTNNLMASNVTGLLSNNYDLYAFDQSENLEWRNYNAQNFTINNKTGYLYANSDNLTISFSGTLAGNATATSLSYDSNAAGKGFNLIGNPYPCNTFVNRSFYVLNENGSEFTLGNNPVPPCAAILVQAQGPGDSVTFSKTVQSNTPSLTLSVATINPEDNTILDKARIGFNSIESLEKYTLREGNTMLYIPQNGHDYAVADATGQAEMPISFKASQNGSFMLRIEKENLELDYLHLIDNLTGNDIDLLVTPTYTFDAKTSDHVSRFRLVFSSNEVR